MEAPGGTWPSPTATITAPTGTSAYYTTATAAYPTQNGTTNSCGKYHQVKSKDTCGTLELQFGLNYSQFHLMNTWLNRNCSNMWINYDVCVAKVTKPTVSQDGRCGLGVTCQGSQFGKYVYSDMTCRRLCIAARAAFIIQGD